MTNSVHGQIYQRMNEKETEELIAIWQENNQEAWTPEALEAVKAILIERLGELPQPEVETDDSPESEPDETVEYPTDRKLIWIADLSNKLSWAIVGVIVIYTLLRLINQFFVQISPAYWKDLRFMDALIMLLSQVDGLLSAGFSFLVLQAITEIIYLLMDIRELSQPAGHEAK